MVLPPEKKLPVERISSEIVSYLELRRDDEKKPFQSKFAARSLKRILTLDQNTVEEVQQGLDLLTGSKPPIVNERKISANMRTYTLAK